MRISDFSFFFGKYAGTSEKMQNSEFCKIPYVEKHDIANIRHFPHACGIFCLKCGIMQNAFFAMQN